LVFISAFEFFPRSKIQGLGLYAARDLEKHTMVIEYIGEIIRSQLCDYREKLYEAKVIHLFSLYFGLFYINNDNFIVKESWHIYVSFG